MAKRKSTKTQSNKSKSPAKAAKAVDEKTESKAPIDQNQAAPVAEDTEASTPADDDEASESDRNTTSQPQSEPDDENETEEEAAPVAEDPKVFWVEGFGNVNAKSQAEAEKKAKKILEDRRK